ncbi:hypothetical protein RhiirA4_392536, partial [Rhizophagus irregularis]
RDEVWDQANSLTLASYCNLTKSNKVLSINPEYLDWHAKLSGLPTDKIRSNLYKSYKKETGHEPSEAVINMSAKPQTSDFKPITFEAKSDPELIIKSVLEHFSY